MIAETGSSTFNQGSVPELVQRHWALSGVRARPGARRTGTVSVIDSDQGSFVVKVAGSWKAETTLERDLGGLEYLRRAGFQLAPELLRTSSGDSCVRLGIAHIYLLKFREGETSAASVVTYQDLGRLAAALHSVPGFPYVSERHLAACLPRLADLTARYSLGDAYLGLIVANMRILQRCSSAVCHFALSPGNTVVSPVGGMTLVGCGELGLGPAVFDLGGPLVTQFVTEGLEFRRDWAEAFYGGYFSARPLSPVERQLIFTAGLMWAGLNVMYGDAAANVRRLRWAFEHSSVLQAPML